MQIFSYDKDVNKSDLLQFPSLLAFPRKYKDFLHELKRYGTSKICTAVWAADSIAYRCNTCALNANMALCVECFDPDKHKSHDFNKFRTETAEGKCDCGDGGIMRPEGFCDKASIEVTQPPEDLIESARILLPQMVVKTFQMLLKQPESNDAGIEYLMLSMLEDYAESSVHLRDIIVSALIDKQLYRRNFMIAIEKRESLFKNACECVYKHGEDSFRNLVEQSDRDNVNLKENILDAIYLMAVLTYHNTTFFKFFVKFSADPTFKKSLAKVFSRSYISAMWSFNKRKTWMFDNINYNRFTALSSQILTWSSQSLYLTNELKLPRYILLLLHYSLSLYVSSDTKKYNFENIPDGFKKNLYLPVAQNLQFIFGNRQFIFEFAENHMIFKIWLDILVEFQGIEANERNMDPDVQGRVLVPFGGMNADFEICISPALMFVQAFKESRRAIHRTLFFRYVAEYSVLALNENDNQSMTISFHIPLFRVFFMFIACDIQTGNFTHENFEFEQGFIKFLLPNVFRIWSAAYEMVINWWPFNGVYVHEASKLYKVPHFTTGTVDPDIFMGQLAASQVNPNFLVQTILSCFHTLYDLESRSSNYFSKHQPAAFIDQVLLYFAMLVASRALAGENDDGSLRTEVICVLATKERSKPALLEMIPDRGVNLQYKWLENLEQILDDVAILENKHFGASNEPLSRTFSLKPRVFIEEFDPILAHMRSVHMGGMEVSIANYYKSVERERLNRDKIALWPPYRKPLKEHHPFLDGFTNFLHCISLHALLFKILYRCMHESMGDNTLQIAIHLLNMSFSYPYTSRKLPVPSQFLICKNCFIPFDLKFNVLSKYGLLHLFDYINERTELSDYTDDQKERQIGFLYSSNLVDYHASAAYVPNLAPLTTENRSEETILSLLLKLFEKHTNKYYKPVNTMSSEAPRYGSYKSSGVRIGGAEFFIGEVLDSLVKNSEEILEVVEEYVAEKNNVEEQEPQEGEDRKARLKRLAQEKKERAIWKMRKKKKAFQMNNEESELETADEPEEVPLCCLCSKPLFQGDVEDLPTTVVFITRTNLMGHRICKPHPFMSRLNINTFGYYSLSIGKLNKTYLPQAKKVSQWFDNLWVQSCGHEMHFSCYDKFIEENMTQLQFSRPEHERYKIFTSEFWCPYCRQLCNGVLPSISTPIFAGPLKKPRVLDYESILSIISEPSQKVISRQINNIIKHLPDIVQASQIQFSFFADLLRNNMELLLMNKSLLAQEVPQDEYFSLKNLFKNIPIISVYNICRYALINRDRGKMMEVMKVLDPYDDEQSRYNLALADAKQLLVTTVIFMSQPTHELIKSVIHFFMNLYLLQLLSWMVVAADEGEIKDWIVEENLSGTQLDFILSLALNTFQRINIKRQREEENRSVYTTSLTAKLTEFMKFCVVLYYSVLNFSDALKEDLESYELWDFYDLLLDGQLSGNDHISFVKCFGWEENMITIYSEKICKDIYFLTLLSSEYYMMARDLTTLDWELPKLISLPNTFDEIYDTFAKMKLESYETTGVTRELKAFLCLVCANFVPINLPGTTIKDLTHAEWCGRGTCILLEPEKNLVHIIWDKRSSIWDSIYVDKHGDTNVALRRFKDMYLSPQRLHMLENMWLFNSFDVFAKNWDFRIH